MTVLAQDTPERRSDEFRQFVEQLERDPVERERLDEARRELREKLEETE